MSGKSKQARVKNNAKPSSSSRSAELLGNTVTTFVGFSVHPEHGIISLTPGLSDNWTDSLKSNVDPQLQLILRKMSKKDPVTKVKALQEFCELLNCCDVLEVKGILPLWPKLYQNFANDFDHRVRESSQEVLKVMALKFKKLMAPYIKQLAPFWIASQFDNYAPAASIASSSLTATFNSKVRDVCIFCRNEIMEYVVRNITFHSSSTFSSSKNCVPEEAEHKYQRVVHCSLKTVSFFLQLVNDIEYEKIRESFYNILTSSKFWSFSKSKDPRVKSSWFEVLYTMLLNKSLENLLINFKDQIIAVSFENISESEPLVTPHVWGCILLEQSMFDDWYDVISFKKTVMPKISALLRHGRNRNFDIISPNLLPFLSKISEKSLEGSSIHDFYKQFFDDIKEGLITFENTSKTEISAFSAAYYECLRYVVQQINNNINDIQEESVDADVLDLEIVAKRLFSENIFNLLTWCFTKGGLIAKHVMMHTSMLIAFWSDPAKSSKLYVELLNTFWNDILSFMLSGFSDERDDEEFLTLIIELMYKLYNANSKTEHQKVNFVLKDEEENSKLDVNKNDIDVTQNKSSGSHKEQSIRKSTSVIYYESDLKNLVIQLVRLCVDKCINKLGYKYLPKIRKLSHLFKDADFYARISEEKTVEGTLYQFLRLMDTIDDNSYDDTIDMTFQALNFIPKDERDDFIKENLLTISHPSVQYSVINRLLSHPLVVEPEVRTMLSYPDACTILINFARDVVNCHSKDSLNLLRKCFFQNEEGEIPINQKTAEQILEILSEPLTSDKENKADLCGSFIAQIMPVICGEGNTSPEFQRNMFLKLFQMSIERISDQFISEDTLWEISTSWQDALSSQDIVADIGLFQDCKAIVEKYLQKNQYLTIEIIESIATSITQFLVCSTEHIEDEQEHSCKIYLMIEEIFEATNNRIFNKNIKQMQELCLFLEALLGKVSTNNKFNDQCMKNIEMLMTLRQVLLNCCIIYRLVCKVPKTTRSVHDDDRNMIMNKNWSPALYDETLRCISIASVGDSLYSISQSEFKLGMELLQIKEKLKSILRNGHQDFISNLKNRMLNEVTKNVNISATRSLLYLVHINQYNTFEENATVVLFDDLTVMLSSRNDLRAYVNTLQFFLPHLSSKVMTSELLIERTEFRDKWIRAAILRCLVRNNFNSDYNKTSEYLIVEQTMGFIFELSQLQHANKELLLYNVEIHKQAVKNVVNTVEFMNILKEVITNYPYELTTKNWDTIRVGLCSWVLSSSKSIDHLQNPRVAIFLVNVFKFYATLANFIKNERQKSSTEFLRNIIDEWDKLFDREISLVLFKIYHNLLENQELSFRHSVCYNIILEAVSPSMEYINYQIVYNHYKTQPTNVNIISFLLKNLSNSAHCIRTTCLNILKHMTQYFVGNDICSYKNIENLNSNTTTGDWHFLCMFEEYIERYGTSVHKYFFDFTFKLNEVDELKPIDRNKSLSYMFLWDCIIHACANSPMSLRSVYTNWLHEKRYEEMYFQKFLFFLIRVMPVEILKNHDSKLMCTDVFKGLTWNQIQDRKLAVEKYACHLYTEVLRKLPAVVRKWYNTCQWRQKTFIDKLTTNFVSPIICNEELGAIGTKKEKHVNMQVTVHTSTREVIAVYSIDEVRMELVITLAQNHPLGPVKVATGKQIGGRLSSRNTGMQLTIFLTHQNGSIFDGLTLWKNNLDKKFEGIEECYVCYTVIHQETCQLPKLTCKTCKKKFHGPCLYKWFTTSSKSTCPICRNIF